MDYESKFCDKQYLSIVQDILKDDEVLKLKEITHHGLDRLGHSLRVSYYSYKISKLFGLDYQSTARAGLLHDFFFESSKGKKPTERLKNLVNHPKYALKNANDRFFLNNIEKNIIVSHMFPVSITVPRYIEGWIVNLTDDVVAIGEICYKSRVKLSYAINFIFIFLFANFR